MLDDGAALAVRPPGHALESRDGRDVWIGVLGSPYFAEAALARSAERDGFERTALEVYRERGVELLGAVRGEFSLVVLDRANAEALLAIDRVGGRYPLLYRERGGVLVFASHGHAIEAHPAGRADLDPGSLYHYLYFHVVPGTATVRRDVSKLLPGSYALLRGDRVERGRYWQPHYTEDAGRDVPRLEEEFDAVLRDSVRRFAGGARVGCFLSGGTDSSTVAGIAGEEGDGPARTYSIGFDVPGYDEMRYARIAASRFGTEHHEYYMTADDLVQMVPRIALAYSDPFGNESAAPAYHCARLAREDGVERMLAGDGGDELFAGNQRYAKQRFLGLYEEIPSPLRRYLVEPLARGVPAGERIWPVRKLRSYIARAGEPMPDRLEAYNHVERFGPSRMMHPAFLEQVDPDSPRRWLRDVYSEARADGIVNRMLALDLQITLADNDLPKVSRMCELAGVEVAYPLLSDEMVAFSLRLPRQLKLKGLKLRYFWKHALRNYLPREILDKKKHGFGTPFGIWMSGHRGLRDLCVGSLNDLKSRTIVREDFIDELLRLHGADHAPFYGVMIWVLVVLEEWLKANAPATSFAG
jgi:asparagine synthase (glutamine-hydrolysing)